MPIGISGRFPLEGWLRPALSAFVAWITYVLILTPVRHGQFNLTSAVPDFLFACLSLGRVLFFCVLWIRSLHERGMSAFKDVQQVEQGWDENDKAD